MRGATEEGSGCAASPSRFEKVEGKKAGGGILFVGVLIISSYILVLPLYFSFSVVCECVLCVPVLFAITLSMGFYNSFLPLIVFYFMLKKL